MRIGGIGGIGERKHREASGKMLKWIGDLGLYIYINEYIEN